MRTNEPAVRIKPAEVTAPWLAWGRSAPSHKGAGYPIDHATLNGKTTLCGMKEIGGHDRGIPFDDECSFSCKRCRAALAKSTKDAK